jgi:hypothetical protein
MQGDFLPADSPRWSDLVAEMRHDFYQLPGYVRLAAQKSGGVARCFVAEENGFKFVSPLIVRDIPSLPGQSRGGPPRRDAVSPYGYSTPLMHGPPDASTAERDAFLRAALCAFVDRLKVEGLVSTFYRLHPILTLNPEPLAELGHVVDGGETVTIDLRASAEEMWRQTRRDHRREINKAKRRGDLPMVDTSWECLGGFVRAYQATMDRVGAEAHYFFSEQDFLELRKALGDRLHLVVVKIAGRVAAAGLFTEVCGIVQYHLSGTMNEFLPEAPMKLLLHFARLWFKERGNSVLHLGGGLGARQDSLMDFKAGFSNGRARFRTWRLITDPHAYDALVREWEARNQQTAPGPGEFFPAYRKSVN